MEGDTGKETEKELTSTSTSSLVMGKLLSTTNKEEKNDSNDTVPTSSTDASTSIKSTDLVSDDIISSTSSEADSSKTKTMDTVDNSSVTFEAELLGMSMKRLNEKIEENVDDLVNDLETLLGETSDTFMLNRKTVEPKKENEKEKTEVSSHDDIANILEEKLDNEVSSNTETATVATSVTVETENIEESTPTKMQDSINLLESKIENNSAEIVQEDLKINETTSSQSDVTLDSNKDNLIESEVIEIIQPKHIELVAGDSAKLEQTLENKPGVSADLEVSVEKCNISLEVENKQNLLSKEINEEQTKEEKHIVETESYTVEEQNLPSAIEETKSEGIHPEKEEEKTEVLVNKNVEDTSGIVQNTEETSIEEEIIQEVDQIIEKAEITEKTNRVADTTTQIVADVKTINVSEAQIPIETIVSAHQSASEDTLVKNTTVPIQIFEENDISEATNEEILKPAADKCIIITEQIESVTDDDPKPKQFLENKTQEATISAKLDVSDEKCSISMEIDNTELKGEAPKEASIEAPPTSEEVSEAPLEAITVSDPSVGETKIGDAKSPSIIIENVVEEVPKTVVELGQEGKEPDTSENNSKISEEPEENPMQENVVVVQELEIDPEDVHIVEKPEEITQENMPVVEESETRQEKPAMPHENVLILEESVTVQEYIPIVEEITQENVSVVKESEMTQKDVPVAEESDLAQKLVEDSETVLENILAVEEREAITQENVPLVELTKEKESVVPEITQIDVPVTSKESVAAHVVEEISQENVSLVEDSEMTEEGVPVVEEPEELTQEIVPVVQEPEISEDSHVVEESKTAQEGSLVIEEITEKNLSELPDTQASEDVPVIPVIEEPEEIPQESISVVEEPEITPPIVKEFQKAQDVLLLEEMTHENVPEDSEMTEEDLAVVEEPENSQKSASIVEKSEAAQEDVHVVKQLDQGMPIVEEPEKTTQKNVSIVEKSEAVQENVHAAEQPEKEIPIVEEPKTITQKSVSIVENSEAPREDVHVEQADGKTQDNVPVVEELEMDQEETPVATQSKTAQEDVSVVVEPEMVQEDVPVVEESEIAQEDIPVVKEPKVNEDDLVVKKLETAHKDIHEVELLEEPTQENRSIIEKHEMPPEDVPVVEKEQKIEENGMAQEDVPVVKEPEKIQEKVPAVENEPNEKPKIIQENVLVAQMSKENSESKNIPVVAEPEIIEKDVLVVEDPVIVQEQPKTTEELVPIINEIEQIEDIEMASLIKQKDIVVEKGESSEDIQEKPPLSDSLEAKKTCEEKVVIGSLTKERNKKVEEKAGKDDKIKESIEEIKLVSEVNIRRKTVEQDLEKIVCLSEESSDSDISRPASSSLPKPTEDLSQFTEDLPQYTEESTLIRIAEDVDQFVVDEESLPQIENVASVSKEVFNCASNFETAMAVASLQNETVSESHVERRLSEKEIREMEAIRMAVASITDSSQDNSYDSYLVDNTLTADSIQEFVSEDIEDTKSAEDIHISEVATYPAESTSVEVVPKPLDEKEICEADSAVPSIDTQEQITEVIKASAKDVSDVEPCKLVDSDSAQVDLIEDTNGANTLRKGRRELLDPKVVEALVTSVVEPIEGKQQHEEVAASVATLSKEALVTSFAEPIEGEQQHEELPASVATLSKEALVTSVVDPIEGEQQHEEAASVATLSKNKSPVEQVEESPIEQVKEAPIEQVAVANVKQVKEAPIKQVNETPVEQVTEGLVEQVSDAPVEQVKAPEEQVNKAPVEQVESLVEQANKAPVQVKGPEARVKRGPARKVKEVVVEQVKAAPVGQVIAPTERVKRGPAKKVKEVPVEQVKEAPLEQVIAPAERVKRGPAKKVKEVPVKQEAPVEQVIAPEERVKRGQTKKVKEVPVEPVEEAPVKQVEIAHVEQVEEAPIEHVKEASIEKFEKVPIERIGKASEVPAEHVKEVSIELVEKAPVEAVEKASVKQLEKVTIVPVAEERPKRTRRNKVIEPLSINVEEVDKKEKIYSPKITIKAIKAPDEEVSTTSADADANKGSLKITITKQSDKMHSILKVCDPEDQIEEPDTQEEPIRKLIIKPKMQQVEQQHSPKMSTRSTKAYSPTSTRCSSPRITIKPVTKPVTEIKTDAHSPLKITLKSVMKPEEVAKKLSPKSPKDQEQKNHNPKITIKPIPKPVEEEKEESQKFTIKAIKRHLEEDGTDVEQGRSSPKVTIKPVVKPQEEYEQSPTKLKIKPMPSLLEKEQLLSVKTVEDEAEEEVKERIVLKINKGNLPSPVKDLKKREYAEDEKLEKAGIKLKFSTTGGTTHIVQDGEETSNKRQRKDSGYSAPIKFVEEISQKRPLEEKLLEKNKRIKNNVDDKNEDSSDAVKIVETKLDSPIVISEDSRSQHSDCIILDNSVPDISKIADIASRTTHIGVITPVLTVGVATPISTPSPTPTPKKRGRPRKAVLVVREEFTPAEASPSPSATSSISDVGTGTPEASPSPGGRPKRSCRGVGQNVTAILGMKPRKPRGGGRGRGGKVNMGDRPPPAVAQASPAPPVVAPPVETVPAKTEKVKKVKSQKKKKKSRRKSKLK